MSQIEYLMPLLESLMVLLGSLQWLFYINLNANRSKFIALFRRAIYDATGFLLIFFLNCVVFGLILHLMRARFDDGGNFGEDYDTNFNDYAHVFGAGVTILAILRNSVGDL